MRQEPVNILTATPAGRAWRKQRRKFWLARRPRWVAEQVVARQSLPVTLKRLDFIHTAAWWRLERFPRLPGVEPEDPDLRWVLFTSNLNGGWEAYLDSFLDAFGRGIRGLWQPTHGFGSFPGPGTRYDLHRWVQTRLVDSGLYYSAYPGATTHDVRVALRVTREVRAFVAEIRAGVVPVAERVAMLAGLARRLQSCLGEVVPTARPWPALGPRTADGSIGVLSVAPIRAGEEGVLARKLARLAGRATSPFAQVPGTHFARFAIIDRARAGLHVGHHVVLRNSWLLFGADFDGRTAPDTGFARRPPMTEWRRFASAVAGQGDLAGLWQHCEGGDGTRTLEEHLSRTLVEHLAAFRDYPLATVRDVLVALDVQDHFRRQVLDGRMSTAADLDGLVDAAAALLDGHPR